MIASEMFLRVSFCVCAFCTLGAGMLSTCLICNLLLVKVALLTSVSSLAKACILVSHMLSGLWFFSASAILFVAAMMTSVGVAVRLVMYLCLKKTVSEILVLLVFGLYISQQR